MKINGFEILSKLFTEEDHIKEDADSSIDELIKNLEATNSARIYDLQKGIFVYDILKTEQGKTFYRGVNREGLELSILLMKKGDTTVTVSQRVKDIALENFFLTLDYSKNNELDPFVDYKVKETIVEEDGYPQLLIEELVLDGRVVAERVTNYRDRKFIDDRDGKQKEALLCLSDYALGGIEIIYDKNQKVKDMDTLGHLRLNNLNVDQENLRESIKYHIMNLIMDEYTRLEGLFETKQRQK